MSYEPARTADRRTRPIVLAALTVLSVTVSAAATSGRHAELLVSQSPSSPIAVPPLAPQPPVRLPGEPPSALGKVDGLVPDGVTVFDDWYPSVTKLDPNLRNALRRATTAAAGDGINIFVTSGWRSRAYQSQLLREAVSRYGSRSVAARWVATADRSPHVSGEAVDLGPKRALAWLSKHGVRYGLCQIYQNEPWHFELRPRAMGRGCPPMYADPTHDPRMQ
jgi:zinc D-Ala-D-Ala carboxypeptidase